MRRLGLVFLGCQLVSAAVWAQSSSPDATWPAEKFNQRVAQNQAEIEHLRQHVSEQESASEQAAERLQQQDRTIAELRKQLKAAQDDAMDQHAGR